MALKVGLIGLPRASAFVGGIRSQPDVEITAGCDTNAETLEKLSNRFGIAQRFTDYRGLLDTQPDVVIICTPMPFHVPQSVAALERGIHVLSEIPACVDLKQAWQLVHAARSSSAFYMMGANSYYLQQTGIIWKMVRQGLFGDIYYGEGDYIHELKELNEQTPWRRIWQTGRRGITYGDWPLCPLLLWFNERVMTVGGFGSGQSYVDARGISYENDAASTMLCTLASGGLIRVRVDMLSNRPHLYNYFSLQGTKGCFEAARGVGDMDKIWLADRNENPHTWRPLSDFAEEFMPEAWRRWGSAAAGCDSHQGADFMQVVDFLTAVRDGKKPEIDVYGALDLTLPGLVSQESIIRGSMMLPVPDFRSINRFPEDLPPELQDSGIMELATPDGQPVWSLS